MSPSLRCRRRAASPRPTPKALGLFSGLKRFLESTDTAEVADDITQHRSESPPVIFFVGAKNQACVARCFCSGFSSLVQEPLAMQCGSQQRQSLRKSDVTLRGTSRLFLFKKRDGLTSNFDTEVCEVKGCARKFCAQYVDCPPALLRRGDPYT